MRDRFTRRKINKTDGHYVEEDGSTADRGVGRIANYTDWWVTEGMTT